MAPIFGNPNYNFLEESEEIVDEVASTSLTEMTFWYMMTLILMLLIWIFVFLCLRIIGLRHKTRNPQQRRMYVGSRARPSLTPAEPTVYVSPSNYPPPPKYEFMAPPSYEEVVGIHNHYPQLQVQPITMPIATAMAQSPNENARNSTDNTRTNDETVVTVVSENRRTSAVTANSS